MKKIVLLSERLPYPPTSGTKNLLYNYCKILHEKLNLEVINISFLEQDEIFLQSRILYQESTQCLIRLEKQN